MDPSDWLELWQSLKSELGWLWLPLGLVVYMMTQILPAVWRAVTFQKSELQELKDSQLALQTKLANLQAAVERIENASQVREIAEEAARRQIENLHGRL